MSPAEFVMPAILVIGFCAVAGVVGWAYLKPDDAEQVQASALEPSQLTQTAVAAVLTSTATATASPRPPLSTANPGIPTATPTQLPTSTQTHTPTPEPVSTSPVATPAQIFNSPILPTATLTPTITITATPWPYDYAIVGYQVEPETEKLYSYVSGWVVEQDGSTPRPAAVTLRYPGGVMRWPRPRAMDVANGRYEFLVSPGRYWLQVDDPGAPVIQIDVVSDNERHEISFRLRLSRPLPGPAISNPWRENAEIPVSARPATPTATPTPGNYGHKIYFPGLMKNAGRHQLYLPVVIR
jgi:hypothetical protein